MRFQKLTNELIPKLKVGDYILWKKNEFSYPKEGQRYQILRINQESILTLDMKDKKGSYVRNCLLFNKHYIYISFNTNLKKKIDKILSL